MKRPLFKQPGEAERFDTSVFAYKKLAMPGGFFHLFVSFSWKYGAGVMLSVFTNGKIWPTINVYSWNGKVLL